MLDILRFVSAEPCDGDLRVLIRVARMSSTLILVLCMVLVALIAAQEDPEDFIPSTLLESARNDDIEGIRRALQQGTHIDITNVNGWSAASFAVTSGNINALHALIDAGIDLNQAATDGRTPLMFAAQQGDKEMVESLLGANADPSITTDEGISAYEVAVESGRKIVALQIAEACVLRGIYNDDADLITISIKRGAYINIPTPAGWTALIYATSTGNELLSKELVKLGADVNRAESDGWTPLHFAAHNGHKAIVDLLLRNGANTVYYSKGGSLARDLALASGFQAVHDMIPEPDQDL